MKKIFQKLSISVIVFLLLAQVGLAQKRDTTSLRSSTKSYDLYMQRHKNFSTIGWVLLAPGTIMTVVGVVTVSSNNFFSTASSTGSFLTVLGGVMMLGSIPCFILSGSNARKAALGLKTSALPGPGGLRYAAVSLNINF
jgi:uncharacterized membrane protein